LLHIKNFRFLLSLQSETDSDASDGPLVTQRTKESEFKRRNSAIVREATKAVAEEEVAMSSAARDEQVPDELHNVKDTDPKLNAISNTTVKQSNLQTLHLRQERVSLPFDLI